MAYSIQMNVPIPEMPARSKYPWARMQPSDSILFDDPREYERVLNAAYGYARRNGWKITTRVAPDGLRIWRIE